MHSDVTSATCNRSILCTAHTKQINVGQKETTTGPMCNYLNEIDLIEHKWTVFEMQHDTLVQNTHSNVNVNVNEKRHWTYRGNEALKNTNSCMGVSCMEWNDTDVPILRTCVRVMRRPAHDLTLDNFNLPTLSGASTRINWSSNHLRWNFLVVWLILLSTERNTLPSWSFSLYCAALFFARRNWVSSGTK